MADFGHDEIYQNFYPLSNIEDLCKVLSISYLSKHSVVILSNYQKGRALYTWRRNVVNTNYNYSNLQTKNQMLIYSLKFISLKTSISQKHFNEIFSIFLHMNSIVTYCQ